MRWLTMKLRLPTVISLLLTAIWLCTTAYAATPPMAPLGELTEELSVPGAVDVDSLGNLYVADSRRDAVVKFDKFGDVAGVFDGFQVSGLGLAVVEFDGSTIVYVSGNGVVTKLDGRSGVILGTIAADVAQPAQIAASPHGYIYVADPTQFQIHVYHASNDSVTTKVFGRYGTRLGQFKRIDEVAFNPLTNQVVVADGAKRAPANDGKIQIFSVLGAAQRMLSTNTTSQWGSPVLFTPAGIAFDDLGRGYFLEYGSSAVLVQTSGYTKMGAFQNAGTGENQLNYVADAVFDPTTDRLFVSTLSGKVVIIGVDNASNPVYTNYAPSVPVLQSPIGGSAVASVQPTLTFENSTDANGDAITYTVTVSQGVDVVATIEVDAAAGPTTSVVVPDALDENASYDWSVLAKDSEGASASSASTSFVVNSVEEAPSAPALIAPANGQVVSGTDLLQWSVSTDPDPSDTQFTYHLEVATDASFSQVVAAETFSTTQVAVNALAAYADLDADSAYAWRVTAYDDGQTASESSETGQFVFDTAMLSVTANVPGAQVFFSGNHAYAGSLAGEAPISLRDVASGTVSIVVERSGFELFVTSVTISEGDSINVSAVLVPAQTTDQLIVVSQGINGRTGLTVGSSAVPFVVDFDNNGTLDLLTGDAAGQLQVFPNMVVTGLNQLYFDAGSSLDLPVLPGAVPFVADFDSDGRKDLVVGLADGSVKLFLNVGLEEAPAFDGGQDLSAGGAPLNVGSSAAPAIVDFNSDGLKDLLVGNAAGEIAVCVNQGSDSAPQFAAPTLLFSVASAAVPFPVDLDEDGQGEIMVTSAGNAVVYQEQGGVYQPVLTLTGAASTSSRSRTTSTASGYFAAFPIDIDGGDGKEMIIGYQNGQLGYLDGSSDDYVASFQAALVAKVDELGALVAVDAPEHLDLVTELAVLVNVGDFSGCAVAAETLAQLLAQGSAAQGLALELSSLCQ